MVCDDRLIEWDAPPRRSAPSIVDERILTSCAVVGARMDGWGTLAAGNPHVTSVAPRKEELTDGLGVLTPKPVLMDRLPGHRVAGWRSATARRLLWPSPRGHQPLQPETARATPYCQLAWTARHGLAWLL